ncbi:RNA chaperone Hfq [Halanaerobacter jeridensis]|uniref:RNA-binding protein Hfq n=1 Tax=Halanaerobacter jeridensis TaxID=706427 RepID=A0A939BNP4_9FIRM|nr:host factor-I protein [Halanaerobacter jeridensis]
MGNKIKIQDKFLNHVRKEKIQVTIYLVNGVRLTGTVEGFDDFIIMVESDKGQQMVYKHAVSTIEPAKKVDNLFG